MFTVKFSVPTHGFQSITCTSEPMPQGELADFIRTLTESGHSVLAVDADHPEWYDMDGEEVFMDEEELEITEEF